MNSLRNSQNFVLIGRKGTGKSSCCLSLSHAKRLKGYNTTFYNFSEEVGRSELKEAVHTQNIDLKSIDTTKLFESILEAYDFRDMWKRKVLHRIALDLPGSSTFKSWVTSIDLSENGIADGLERGLNLPLPEPAKSILGTVWHGANKIKANSKISLKDFVSIGFDLLFQCHPDVRHYFFFDELNLSHSKSKTDEYNTYLALIYDIVRATDELNDLFVRKKVDVHVICSLRPEIRNAIIRRDSEMQKVIESCHVNLSWPSREGVDNPLMTLLRKKMENSGYGEDFLQALPEEVYSLVAKKKIEFHKFFLNITWYRPRDVIRILKTYQTTNGGQTILFNKGDDQVRFLKEYSRISIQDISAELEVKYSRSEIDRVTSLIRQPNYENADDLKDSFAVLERKFDLDELLKDLFEAGVIFNYEVINGHPRVFASYRDDANLIPDMGITIHRGLQQSLGIF